MYHYSARSGRHLMPTDPSPVTSDDLQYIAARSADAPSEYHGVYPTKSGRWQARAFKRRICTPTDTARQAAVKLVQWWQTRYGAKWRAAWLLRQTAGWSAVRTPGGVWALAEVCGEAVVLVGRDAKGNGCEAAMTAGARPFRDKESAARGVAEWAVSVFGREAKYVVRRTWAEKVNRARLTPVPVEASC